MIVNTSFFSECYGCTSYSLSLVDHVLLLLLLYLHPSLPPTPFFPLSPYYHSPVKEGEYGEGHQIASYRDTPSNKILGKLGRETVCVYMFVSLVHHTQQIRQTTDLNKIEHFSVVVLTKFINKGDVE